MLQQLRPKGCCDELGSVREFVDHVGNGLPIHRVQRLVDLVKQVERCGVTLLDGEDESHGDERLLAAA